MLYILKQEQGSGLFYLIQNKEYVVGRKNADIVLGDDQSISRKHAVIKITSNSAILTDCASKYGTFHNKSKVSANVDVCLKHNDIVKFGAFNNKYIVEKVTIITTGSGLTNEQKNELSAKVSSLGGLFVNNWDDSCTFLTTHEIILTIKVLHALIDNKPMVTLKFWEECLKNMAENKPLPNTEDFKPPVTETLINKVQLSANESRKTLFKGKTFVFSSEKVKKKMSDLIAKTGGSSISWDRQILSKSDVTKSKNKYIFIHEDLKDIPLSLKGIYDHLTRIGERTIPLQEIAMAVVLCSCEKDCNPKFNRLCNVFKPEPNDSQSQVFSLAANTPSEDGWNDDVEVPKRESFIPPTLEEDIALLPTPGTSTDTQASETSSIFLPTNDVITTSKRTPDDLDSNPPKRIKVNESSGEILSNESVIIPRKRQAEDSLASTSKRTPVQTSLNTFLTPTETKKRKSQDGLDSGRKKTSKANPFALMRTGENPFAALRVRKEPDNDDDEDNPFMQTKRSPAPDKTPVLPKAVEAPHIRSSIESYTASDNSNITWTSTSLKSETKTKISDSETIIAPDIKKIFDMFKNTVVIDVIPIHSFRIMNSATPVKHETSLGKKNFKKFKKVQPIHPQTTILVTSFQAETQANEITILSDGEEEENDEPEEEEIRRPVKKKVPVSRFDF